MCRHMFSLPDGSALIKEDLFSLQSLAIQILTLCPSPMLPLLLFAPNQQNFDRKASDSSNQDLGNRIISMADYLLKVFSVQFWREETTALSLTAHYAMERYPILVRYHYLRIQQTFKLILFIDIDDPSGTS